jgi:hypothetical protein
VSQAIAEGVSTPGQSKYPRSGGVRRGREGVRENSGNPHEYMALSTYRPCDDGEAMSETPPALHEALGRVHGLAQALDDEEAEIGVTREQAESYARHDCVGP